MTYFEALILGITEGITEFLPISSTGHLILVSHLLGIPDSDFLKSFEIAIQMGAIFAVALLYFRSFFSVPVILRLFCGFLPTAIIGFTLYPFIKGYLIGNLEVVVFALMIGGILLIVFELFHKETELEKQEIVDITYKQAFLVGLFQSIAIIPGVSRSGATIIGGLWVGLKRVVIVEFSFLLAVPTMVAATGYDLLKNYEIFSSETIPVLLLGFGTSFLVALIVITSLLKYIKKHSFISFGIYRIVLSLVFLLFVL